MTAPAEILNQLLAQVRSIRADDLCALAKMHTRYMELTSGAASSGNGALLDSLHALNAKVEQILLREVRDADTALQELARDLALLKGQLEGAPNQSKAPAGACAIDGSQFLSDHDLQLVTDFITAAEANIEVAEAALLALTAEPADPETIRTLFRSFHTVKGVAGFLNLRQIGALTHAAENLLDRLRRGRVVLTEAVVDTMFAVINRMKRLVAYVETAARTGQAVAIDADLEPLLKQITRCFEGREISPPFSGHAKPKEAASAVESKQDLSAASFNNLINRVGEQVIAEAMGSQDAKLAAAGTHKLAGHHSDVAKIMRKLLELSTSVRMVSIHDVFQMMARLASDLANKSGKQIDFVHFGGETKLDRTQVQEIADALVHIIRNAVDHGLEAPADREAAGKPRSGKLELKAYHHGGNFVLEISDDGRGLDKAKIVHKAVAAGIIPAGAELTDQEIFNLIFHPGLSTAEAVTEVSGRGVGMDVVKRNVESLRGRIEIASAEGKGTSFTIRLPLALAVIDGLAHACWRRADQHPDLLAPAELVADR